MIKWSIPSYELAGHSAVATELFAIALALAMTELMVAAIIWIAALDETGDAAVKAHGFLVILLFTAAGLALPFGYFHWATPPVNNTSSSECRTGTHGVWPCW